MGNDMTLERLQRSILDAFQCEDDNYGEKGPKICELMTHPGYPTNKEYGGFCWGTDDFGASEDRSHELKLLCSREMMDFYKENNIKISSHSAIFKGFID